MSTTTQTYRRNITKSRSGHYRLTLTDKSTCIRVTSKFGWTNAEQARSEDEARLAVLLGEYNDSGSVYFGDVFREV